MSEIFRVAKEVISYCTRCRLNLNHVIVAMQGDRIVRVECKTCRGVHGYRPVKAEGAVRIHREKKKSAPKKAVRTVYEEWETLRSQHSGGEVKAYSIREFFKKGDWMSHPKYGEGYVEREIHPDKIEVIFRTDVKTLIHSGQRK